MNSNALFGLSILMSFIAFGIVTKLYIWRRLRGMRCGVQRVGRGRPLERNLPGPNQRAYRP
jgi:hypothetical protein